MKYVSLVISVLSICISVFTFWKTLFNEKMRYDMEILNIFSPENLVSPLAGITYVEFVITNKSSLPLVLLSSTIDIEQHGILNVELSSNAYMFDSLISFGSHGKDEIKNKSDGLPITIPSKDATHCILAYPTPNILGVDKETTSIRLEFKTNRHKPIQKSAKETTPRLITLEQFLRGRVRQV